MPEDVTDKQVRDSRKRVDELRKKVLAEQVKASVGVTDGANQIKKAALDSEAERLEAQLAAMREANKTAPKALREQTQVVASNEPAPLVNPSVAPQEGAK